MMAAFSQRPEAGTQLSAGWDPSAVRGGASVSRSALTGGFLRRRRHAEGREALLRELVRRAPDGLVRGRGDAPIVLPRGFDLAVVLRDPAEHVPVVGLGRIYASDPQALEQ